MAYGIRARGRTPQFRTWPDFVDRLPVADRSAGEAGFELGWAEIAEVCVLPLAVREHLGPRADGSPNLLLGQPGLAVDPFGLERGEAAFRHRMIRQLPVRLIEQTRPDVRTCCWWASAVYWLPRSVWCSSPGPGRRCPTAIVTPAAPAPHARAQRWPTRPPAAREQASNSTARECQFAGESAPVIYGQSAPQAA